MLYPLLISAFSKLITTEVKDLGALQPAVVLFVGKNCDLCETAEDDFRKFEDQLDEAINLVVVNCDLHSNLCDSLESKEFPQLQAMVKGKAFQYAQKDFVYDAMLQWIAVVLNPIFRPAANRVEYHNLMEAHKVRNYFILNADEETAAKLDDALVTFKGLIQMGYVHSSNFQLTAFAGDEEFAYDGPATSPSKVVEFVRSLAFGYFAKMNQEMFGIFAQIYQQMALYVLDFSPSQKDLSKPVKKQILQYHIEKSKLLRTNGFGYINSSLLGPLVEQMKLQLPCVLVLDVKADSWRYQQLPINNTFSGTDLTDFLQKIDNLELELIAVDIPGREAENKKQKTKEPRNVQKPIFKGSQLDQKLAKKLNINFNQNVDKLQKLLAIICFVLFISVSCLSAFKGVFAKKHLQVNTEEAEISEEEELTEGEDAPVVGSPIAFLENIQQSELDRLANQMKKAPVEPIECRNDQNEITVSKCLEAK